MKKIFISALLLCSSAIGFAQLVNIQSIDKVTLPQGVTVDKAILSPDGSFAVISQNEKGGIYRLDLATNAIKTISTTGNPFELKIANDGTVIFRESKTAENKLRYTSLKAVTPRGVETKLANPTRNLQGFAVQDNSVMTVDNNKLSAKGLNGAAAVKFPVASINKGQLCINGKVISPNGREGASYLWPSISPNGTKVCYYLATKGCYVANIDGSNPIFLGVIRAARWLNDLIVVGMHDIDNGTVVTSSKLVAASIDGKTTQDITVKESFAMFPSTNGNKIAYSTPMGDMFIINLK